MAELGEESVQAVEWRVRLANAIIRREFDDETLLDMLNAGLHQAHSEGLKDAAYICDQVAVQRSNARHVASRLADAIRELDKLNAVPN